MTRISVRNQKPRKHGSDLWISKDGSQIFIGRDYAQQNAIDEAKLKTRSRSCYKECRTCGTCANSKRDNFNMQYIATEAGLTLVKGPTKSFDNVTGRWVDCRTCEPYRFHDCHNGWMRDSRGEAEPFTEEAQRLIKESGGKPLI